MKTEKQKIFNRFCTSCGGVFDWDNALKRLHKLNKEAENQDNWRDSKKATKVMKERDQLNRDIQEVRSFEREFQETLELIELAHAEEDTETCESAEKDLERHHIYAEKLRIKSLLSGELDNNDCFLDIHSGAGVQKRKTGHKCAYVSTHRWQSAKNFKIELLQENLGEEAGIKSATLKLYGNKAFGWAKTESGVHRLVRISPFDFKRTPPHKLCFGMGLSCARQHHSYSY